MFELAKELPGTGDIEAMLLTARQAAKALAISERTLYTLTKTGAIRAVRLSKRGVRYDPADLRAWIDAAKKNSEKPLAIPVQPK